MLRKARRRASCSGVVLGHADVPEPRVSSPETDAPLWAGQTSPAALKENWMRKMSQGRLYLMQSPWQRCYHRALYLGQSRKPGGRGGRVPTAPSTPIPATVAAGHHRRTECFLRAPSASSCGTHSQLSQHQVASPLGPWLPPAPCWDRCCAGDSCRHPCPLAAGRLVCPVTQSAPQELQVGS